MYSRALRIPSSRVFVVLLSVQMLAQSNPRLVGNQSHILRFSDPRIERALSLAQRGRTGTRGASHGSGISRLSASDHSPSVSNLSLDTSSIFAEAATYDSGGGFGEGVAVGDVNGDGKPDLFVANQCVDNNDCSSGTVGVLLGNGDGSFQAAVTYNSGGTSAVSVVVADINGDGKPDLLVANSCAGANCSNGSVGVLLGNGDGSFQSATNYPSGGSDAQSVAVGDVNGDGKPDLVITNRCVSDSDCTKGILEVLLGNGDGTFRAVAMLDSGGSLAYMAVIADVNGDGKPELVVANDCAISGCANGAVGVLLGNGDGTFHAVVSYGSGGGNTFSVAVGDVNGDGKPDVVATNDCVNGTCTNGAVGVLLGNGDGTFQAAVTYGTGGFNPDAVALADVNGDGKPDLLVANFCLDSSCGTLGIIGVLLGNGDGTFQTAISYGSSGYFPLSLLVGEVNGDGRPDLLVANFCRDSFCATNGTVGVLTGNGDGTFQAARAYQSGWSAADSLAVGDVNGDGQLDLVATHLTADSSGATSGTVGVLLGNHDGTFQTAETYDSAGFGTDSVALGDVNGDGKPDLVVANSCGTDPLCANGSVQVLIGNGDGTFQTAASYSSGGYFAYTVAVADVNGDGKPDLLVANNCAQRPCFGTDGIVSVLLGNGDGSFQAPVTYDSGAPGTVSAVVADVNGDGKVDLLVANGCADTNCSTGGVGVLLGNGDGTFQPAKIYGSGGSNTISLALGDMDGDGKPDLVVKNRCGDINCFTNGTVGVLLGNGDGSFQAAITTPGSDTNGAPSQIVLADFNGDGKLDLASGSGNLLLLGNGDGTFQSPIAFGVGTGASGIASGDFNQDGSPDIALGGVMVLFNISHQNTASTTTSLISSANPIAPNQRVTYTATVTSQFGSAITGTVSFKDGNTTTIVRVTGGNAVLSRRYFTTGTHFVTATYSGDSNNSGSVSNTLTEYVKNLPVASQTVVTTSNSPSVVNESVTFTASISSAFGTIPDGETVTFYDGDTPVATTATVGGSATFSTSGLSARRHIIKASYAGDRTFRPSSGKVQQIVNAYLSTVTLSSNPNPSSLGQAVLLTAVVTGSGSPTPTGKVIFSSGNSVLGSSTLSPMGMAILSTTKLSIGVNNITATYRGDALHSGATSSVLTQTVNQGQLTMTLSSSHNPSRPGESIKFTVVLTSNSGAPDGEVVTFGYNGSVWGTGTIHGGKARVFTTLLPTGSDQVTAMYAGDANYGAASASVTQIVRER